MVLSRLGNKKIMKDNLREHFPRHKMRIELFFGSGGSFFYLPIPKYAILNDFDDEVTNLYNVIIDQKDELIKQIHLLPISSSLLNYWKKNKIVELELSNIRKLINHCFKLVYPNTFNKIQIRKKNKFAIKKAIRFLLISNFSYLGKGDTLRLGLDNTKKNIIKNIEPTLLMLQNAKITNCDFRNVIPKISFSKVMPKEEAFVYLDPIYLDTLHTYKVPKWTINDSEDCFKIMKNCGIKCAMSEFNNPKIIGLAKKYKMNVIYLKERKNIKNRKIEILITNYKKNQYEMF